MHKYDRPAVFITLFFFSVVSVFAQQSSVYHSVENTYQEGIALYEKEKYGAAQDVFNQIIEQTGEKHDLMKANAAYYRALCAIYLFNKDAPYLIHSFIEDYPGNPKVDDAQYEMAKYYYRNDSFVKATEWFDTVEVDALPDKEHPEYFFKRGYALFKQQKYAQARVAFYNLLDSESKYAAPANYYYAHIAYEQENYQTALNGFRKLEEDPSFGPIVPYYIIQILYRQDKYETILDYTSPLLDSIELRRKEEVYRIVGEAYYHHQKYDTAIAYLDKYVGEADSVSLKDKYHIAFAYYRVGRYKEAVEQFKPVANQENRWAQNALYHLGDCYLELNKKKQARLAFSSASSMEYDSLIRKKALFHYAEVTYDMSYSPFNDAIKALQRYIERYPNSNKTEQAYKYLVMAYLNTKNYKDAFQSLQNTELKDEDLKQAYQRITYFRGLELYNNLNFEKALSMFDNALQYSSYNREMKVKTYYWKAEACYRLDQYEQAVQHYKTFINSLGAFELKYYQAAHYGLGYAYFNLDNYESASTWFRKYINFKEDESNKRLGDAYNRVGDCFFMQRKYWRAVDFYGKAAELELIDPDYALFKKGFAYGLMNKYDQKIGALTRLLKKHPSSSYYDDALFEAGRAYVESNQIDSAISKFNTLLKKAPESNYISRALVKLGLIYYNNDQNKKAMEAYKKVVENFPKSQERQNALRGIKNLYLDMYDADAYFQYVDNLEGYETVSTNRKDSIKYATAENVYMNGNCKKAKKLFKEYINEYENGHFLLNAHYYKGDCHYSKEQYVKALQHFDYVLSHNNNSFTEDALLKSARIHYQTNNCKKALQYFGRLEKRANDKSVIHEARIQRLRCYYQLNNYTRTIELADTVLQTDKRSESVIRETRYKKGMAYYNKKKWEEALDVFSLIATDVTSKEGAEAKYRVAEIYFKQEKLKNAKKVILNFSEMNTSHQYWMAKSFILLADIYVEEDDTFQAIHTLKSVIKNYDNQDDDILDIARRKKERLSQEQNNNNEPKMKENEEKSPDKQSNIGLD